MSLTLLFYRGGGGSPVVPPVVVDDDSRGGIDAAWSYYPPKLTGKTDKPRHVEAEPESDTRPELPVKQGAQDYAGPPLQGAMLAAFKAAMELQALQIEATNRIEAAKQAELMALAQYQQELEDEEQAIILLLLS